MAFLEKKLKATNTNKTKKDCSTYKLFVSIIRSLSLITYEKMEFAFFAFNDIQFWKCDFVFRKQSSFTAKKSGSEKLSTAT